MMQEIAWLTTVPAVLALAAVFVYVALNSGDKQDYEPVRTRAYRLRTGLFWALVLVIAPVTFFTLVDLPYSVAASQEREALKVDVKGHQWYWEMSRDSARVGQPVVFNVTSGDVNHGFAIYDADLKVVAQTQAMPGYVNKLVHTFTEPGTYQILCLEYCGLSHTRMKAEFHVAAN